MRMAVPGDSAVSRNSWIFAVADGMVSASAARMTFTKSVAKHPLCMKSVRASAPRPTLKRMVFSTSTKFGPFGVVEAEAGHVDEAVRHPVNEFLE